MNAALQRRIQRYGWDRAEALYEESWSEQLAPAQKLLLDFADVRPGERVLDVAAGTGLVTFPAAQAAGPSGFVLATDISDRMVARLSAAAQIRGHANVRAARMDAEDLTGAGEGFDSALCALGLMYVPDPILALRQMLDALKPGGRAVSAVWGQRECCGWAGIFPVVDARVETDVCPLFFQLGTGESQAGAFKAAGFSDIVSERISTTLLYDSREAALQAAFAGGPVALAWTRFDETTRVEAEAAYLETIEPYRDGPGYAIPGEFVVTRGVKPA